VTADAPDNFLAVSFFKNSPVIIFANVTGQSRLYHMSGIMSSARRTRDVGTLCVLRALIASGMHFAAAIKCTGPQFIAARAHYIVRHVECRRLPRPQNAAIAVTGVAGSRRDLFCDTARFVGPSATLIT
jgi:hypothetical protein